MGHAIQGIVLSRSTAEYLRLDLPEVLFAPLRQSFVFVPLSNGLLDLVRLSDSEAQDSVNEALGKLSPSMERILRGVSRRGPVAYIETDYFGGTGHPAAQRGPTARPISVLGAQEDCVAGPCTHGVVRLSYYRRVALGLKPW